MEKKRSLKHAARILIVITIVILVVSLYNLFTFLGSAISGESFGLELNKNEISGDWVFSFDANPRNSGILPVSLYIEVALFDLTENLIASNSSLVYISAGSSQPFSFTLTIPSDFVQGEELKGDEGYMQMTMTAKTFSDLIGFTQFMKIGGG